MSNFVLSRTPVRFSYGGGGTDLESYYRKRGGAVTSVTINKYVYTIVERRTDNRVFINSCDYRDSAFVDHGVDPLCGEGLKIPRAACHKLGITGVNVFTASEITGGSGLGTSCAVACNIINALTHYIGEPRSKYELADQAYKLCHDDLGMHCGRKDSTVAAFGGLNHIVFKPDDTFDVEPVRLNPDQLSELRQRTLLFDTNMRRKSDSILTGQDELDYDDPENGIHYVKESAIKIRGFLEAGDLDAVGRQMDFSWRHKRRTVVNISNELIDRAYDTALEHGALGGRISGAGNGGILIIFAADDTAPQITTALTQLGLTPVDYDFDFDGLKILLNV